MKRLFFSLFIAALAIYLSNCDSSSLADALAKENMAGTYNLTEYTFTNNSNSSEIDNALFQNDYTLSSVMTIDENDRYTRYTYKRYHTGTIDTTLQTGSFFKRGDDVAITDASVDAITWTGSTLTLISDDVGLRFRV